MSNLAESASGAGASCSAEELFRLRCLASFSTQNPALKRPTTALFFPLPSVTDTVASHFYSQASATK